MFLLIPNRIKTLFCCLGGALLAPGCTVGFSNASQRVPGAYSKIYIPAANDSSLFAGQAARLSEAVRTLLANRNDVRITGLEDARFALRIQILSRQQSIVSVDSCNNASGTPQVANGAYNCVDIHPELTGNPGLPTSFNQPAVSPNQEQVNLVVLAKAIDLNDGHVLWQKTYNGRNMAAAGFQEIGDKGDGRTLTYMANKPDLHGLRYQEALDNAVQTMSSAIAADIQNSLLAALPSGIGPENDTKR